MKEILPRGNAQGSVPIGALILHIIMVRPAPPTGFEKSVDFLANLNESTV